MVLRDPVPILFSDAAAASPRVSVGGYLAARLVEAGCKTVFIVPGDFTLALLDELLKNQHLDVVGACNELNAGYAADGNSRATGGLACVAITFMVGGLSLLNAVAGAMAEDLPILIVSGAPNSNDYTKRRLIHHTLGEFEFYKSAPCFRPVVHSTFSVLHLADAPHMIDEAVATCLVERKPVYLEIACNLAPCAIAAPTPRLLLSRKHSDPIALENCVMDVLTRLRNSNKPVLVAGSKLRVSTKAVEKFNALATSLGCGVAIQPGAKGLFNEDHAQFIGIYWGCVSTALTAQLIESADLVLLCGCTFSDYSTTGWTSAVDLRRLIDAKKDSVSVCGSLYSNVQLVDFISALAARVSHHDKTALSYQGYGLERPIFVSSTLTTNTLLLRDIRQAVQGSLSANTELVVDVGDLWFLSQELLLPQGSRYHAQMSYGSTGWSLGALLGIAMAVPQPGQARDLLLLIGDGAFQMAMQEVSTLIRRNIRATVIVINNGGYTTDVCIKDGPFNVIQNWDYAGLVNVINGEDGNGLGIKATTGRDLDAAFKQASSHKGLTLIECIIAREDCSLKLLEWGQRVQKSNMQSIEGCTYV